MRNFNQILRLTALNACSILEQEIKKTDIAFEKERFVVVRAKINVAESNQDFLEISEEISTIKKTVRRKINK